MAGRGPRHPGAGRSPGSCADLSLSEVGPLLRHGDTVDGCFVITGSGGETAGDAVTWCQAVDSRTGQDVLIKAAQAGSPGAAELAREQGILRRLSGASVPQVLDYGEDGHGTVFLILADPGGATLADAWPESDEVDRLLVMERVCAALEALHERGVAWGQLDPTTIRVDQDVTFMDASWASTEGDPGADIYALGVMWFTLVQHEPDILPAAYSTIGRAMAPGRYTSAQQVREAILQALEGLTGREIPGVGICTDIGLVRNANEDHHAVTQFEAGDLYILSDGMGGEAGGVVASRMTVEIVRDTLLPALSRLPAKHSAELLWPMLQEAINQASHAVFERAGTEPALRRMGATIVIAMQVGSHLYVANVGDSRAYLVRDSRVEQLSQDHTVVAQLIDRGDLSPEDAQSHPARGQLIRNIGGRPTAEAHFAVRKLHQGDMVVLCCDGLTDMVSDHEIAQTISTAPTPQLAADRLVNLANSRGGPDNISVIISQYSGGK
jgi:serine/threonine protein phosphatase PrpC